MRFLSNMKFSWKILRLIKQPYSAPTYLNLIRKEMSQRKANDKQKQRVESEREYVERLYGERVHMFGHTFYIKTAHIKYVYSDINICITFALHHLTINNDVGMLRACIHVALFQFLSFVKIVAWRFSNLMDKVLLVKFTS